MFANIVLIVVNLCLITIALLVGEYEVSKLQTPEASWLVTPVYFDLVTVGTVVLLNVINLAVLVFILFRNLDHHRKWIWWTTTVGLCLIAILIGVLGTKFLPILWPTLR